MDNVTVAQVIEGVRSRLRLAGFTSTSTVTDTEVLAYVQGSAKRLAALVDEAWGERYFAKTATLATQANVSLVSLPVDCMAVDLVKWNWSTNAYAIPLEEASNDDMDPYPSRWTQAAPPKYRVLGNALEFFPTPDAAYPLTLRYAMNGLVVAATTDTLTMRYGWDEWLVLDVCAKIAMRWEKDASPFKAEQAVVREDIVRELKRRDRSRPKRIRDVKTSDERQRRLRGWPWG